MTLTKTTTQASFYRPPPTSTTFAFPSSASPDTSTFPPTIITFHVGSEFTTQNHWHVTHTEYIRVRSGAALITVSGVSKVFTAEDSIARVPRYARHEWMRFDRPARLLSAEQREVQEAYFREEGKEKLDSLRGVDTVAEEWTDPADGQKEMFFRNISSTMAEPRYRSNGRVVRLGELWRQVQIMCVMWELDNYVVFVDFGGWKGGFRQAVESGVTYAVMGGLMLLGRLFGCRGVNQEYTPEHLVKRWESRGPKRE